MKPLIARAERYFEFAALGTSWRTEFLAGITTFMTMAYIIFVNPAILSQTGMPLAAVTTSTCLCAGIGSILMGGLANYPLALAPGMGLNAYFTYTVVKGMGVPWQTALGAVFLSGVIFLLLTIGGIRQKLRGAMCHRGRWGQGNHPLEQVVRERFDCGIVKQQRSGEAVLHKGAQAIAQFYGYQRVESEFLEWLVDGQGRRTP